MGHHAGGLHRLPHLHPSPGCGQRNAPLHPHRTPRGHPRLALAVEALFGRAARQRRRVLAVAVKKTQDHDKRVRIMKKVSCH